MAWIHESSKNVWDVEYTDQVKAALKAQELQNQEHIFVNVALTTDGIYEVFTQYGVEGEHSIACRCEQCSNPIKKPGRPKERQGEYEHTAIDIRRDLLVKLDAKR